MMHGRSQRKPRLTIEGLGQELADHRAQTAAEFAAVWEMLRALQKANERAEVDEEGRPGGAWGIVADAAPKFNYSESGIWGMTRRGVVRKIYCGGRVLVSIDDIAAVVQKKQKNIVRFSVASSSSPHDNESPSSKRASEGG